MRNGESLVQRYHNVCERVYASPLEHRDLQPMKEKPSTPDRGLATL